MITLNLTVHERMDLQHAVSVRVLQLKKFLEEVEGATALPSRDKLAAYYKDELARAQALMSKL